ncbi:MAG: right-handed parallel beta-helix repeat-containing protein [Candidatus Thermoplasmatota archaeon]|nr:right-handed parallel beta-helix repeat-containing protein [Candidatus Thermoplasmatota archaeon]
MNYWGASGNNLLDNALYGVYIRGNENLISNNLISKNNLYGVYIIGDNNFISGNNISKNLNGLFWEGVSNAVVENNFILNKNHDARFFIASPSVFFNKWVKNYWDSARLSFKLIFGYKLVTVLYLGDDFRIVLPFPWIGMDKNPANEPYDIP